MRRYVAAFVAFFALLAGSTFVLSGRKDARGAEGRQEWEFKSVAIVGPKGGWSEAKIDDEPETTEKTRLDIIDRLVNEECAGGWEPLDASWLLGPRLLVTFKRPK